VYYPGARQRLGDLCERYPQGKQFPGAEHQPDLLFVRIEDPKPDEYGLRNEAFGPALYEVEVDSGSDANTFLEKAAELVNSDRIWGSLSMTVIIDPKTEHETEFQAFLEKLEWGSVGVNCWGGMAFYFGLGWGAFPKDIQSGNGRLLEALCLQHIQKGVIQAPFANLLQPKLHERFVPQFFKNMYKFEMHHDLLHLPGFLLGFVAHPL
jgi:hypothetical protein